MLLQLLLLIVVYTAQAQSFQPWAFPSFRTASAKENFPLVLDFEGLVLALTTSARSNTKRFIFPLPGHVNQECTLRTSSLLPHKLAAKYPELIIREGWCSSTNTSVFLNLNTQNSSSFSATFTIPGSTTDFYYVDHASSSYVLYAKSNRKGHSFSCGSNRFKEEQPEHHQQRELLTVDSTGQYLGVIFRIAIAANVEYAVQLGNTRAGVLNGIVAVMSRVNGIYMRELGVYFQLVENNDQLLCTAQDDVSSCATYLPNTNPDYIIYHAHEFMDLRGVAYDAYDIGHVFTT